jgi:hypothetical protein
MRHNQHVSWFNPRKMDDLMVAALSTGREAQLEDLFATITQRC